MYRRLLNPSAPVLRRLIAAGALLACFTVTLGGCRGERPDPVIDLLQEETPAAPDEILARVGRFTISRDTFDFRLDDLPPFARKRFEGRDGRRAFLDNLVQEYALVEAALRDDMHRQKTLRRRLRRALAEQLQQAYLRDVIEADPGVPRDLIEAYYEAHKEEFKIPDRWRGRQIVVADLETAQALRRQIEGGADFGALAREHSIDLYTKEQGGQTGWIEMGGPIPSVGRNPEFETLVAQLPIGELSQPLRSPRGFHLVQVLEREQRGYQSLDEALPRILPHLLVSDDEVRRAYESQIDRFTLKPSLELSHILLPTAKLAWKAVERIRRGESFEDVARAMSIDPASKKAGGRLGTLIQGGMVRGFGRLENLEKVAFSMKEGGISQPIKTAAGWHVIRVEDRRDAKVRPLAEVEETLRNQLAREKKQQLEREALQALRDHMGVVVYEDRL